ncbi:MAG: rod shape-determining protein MreC [Firmicutes bacterium]|nr:rod shape-determining protein MreC [Bacillota bacterium]
MYRPNRWVWPTLIGLILILLVLIYSTSGNRFQITVVESVLRDVVSPFESGISSLVYRVKESWDSLIHLQRLRQENIILRQKIARLSAENALLKESARENKRWAELFQFKQTSQYQLLAARVIGRAIPDWFNVIQIDKGKLDGVEPGMAVISTEGVVGQVRQVSANSASVLLALDSRSAIGGITEKSRDFVLLEGDTAEPGLLKVKPLSNDIRLEPGTKILTSGLGQVYPKGLLVGEVVKVKQDRYGLTVTGWLKPATDFARLEEVFVILDK